MPVFIAECLAPYPSALLEDEKCPFCENIVEWRVICKLWIDTLSYSCDIEVYSCDSHVNLFPAAGCRDMTIPIAIKVDDWEADETHCTFCQHSGQFILNTTASLGSTHFHLCMPVCLSHFDKIMETDNVPMR